MDELLWAAVGAGLTLAGEALAWLYWRYWGPGSIQDYIYEEDEPDGEYRILEKRRTDVQRVAVVEHEGATLIYGNGYVMFSTMPGEDLYTEPLIHVPMALAQRRNRVLILGGGGGFTTREVLRYEDVEAVAVVDFDAMMFEFGKSLEAVVKFNKGALNDPKVETVIQDARAFVESKLDRWDVIIIDLPEPSTDSPSLRRCFSQEFYKLLADRLEPGGVVGIACANPSWMPEYFWSIQATLKSAGFHVLPYRYDAMVEEEEDYGYCVAALRPIAPADVHISLPTRYLNGGRMKELFQIPLGIREKKGEARVQTDTNNVLAEMAEDD
jgi:spermidine synthase